MNAIQKAKIRLYKSEQKELAKNIRELKATIRTSGHNITWSEHHNLYDMKDTFRHNHIAHSILRGHSYEQIEQPCEGHEANMGWVNDIIARIKEELAELEQLEQMATQQ